MILKSKRKKISIGDISIEVEMQIRNNDEEELIGLGGQNSLEENKGMLFLGDRNKEGFNEIWMKDMKFPIDIIWIANGRVVHIVENARIPTEGYIPDYGMFGYCDYILEVKVGFVKKYSIGISDNFSLK